MKRTVNTLITDCRHYIAFVSNITSPLLLLRVVSELKAFTAVLKFIVHKHHLEWKQKQNRIVGPTPRHSSSLGLQATLRSAVFENLSSNRKKLYRIQQAKVPAPILDTADSTLILNGESNSSVPSPYAGLPLNSRGWVKPWKSLVQE